MTLNFMRRISVLGAFLTFTLSSLPAEALKVEITQGQVDPVPISVTDFIGGDNLGHEMADVIRSDLEHSGLFRIINKASYLQDDLSAQQSPRFEDWRLINSQCLLTAAVGRNSSNELEIQFRLYDVVAGTQMLGIALAVPDPKKWRQLAHRVADAVYERVTGEKGYFDTRIAYIEETGRKGAKGRRPRRLAIMDWDGHNNTYLTDGAHMVLTPRFSPNNRDIVYLSFINKVAQVHVHNLETRKDKLLGRFEGMSFAPRYSPDGNTVVMSLVKGGLTALYRLDLGSGQFTPLTKHFSIDTSPCFSPDGQEIVFTSDRDKQGREQLFIMDANGGNVRRISFGDGTYSQPNWSPRGDLIAFTKKISGQFYIGVMNPDGSNERLIADGHLVEAPTWSPNGRVIMFTRESRGKGGGVKLFAVDVTGRNQRAVRTPREAADGSWSRLLSETGDVS